MRPAPKKRLETNADLHPRPGLNSPFASLNLGPLPEGPAAPITPQSPAQNPQNPQPGPSAKLGRVVLRRETAHRGGKVVVVADGFASHLSEAWIENLGKKLRAACGCGGSCKERTIELQGEQVASARAFLEKEGFLVAGLR